MKRACRWPPRADRTPATRALRQSNRFLPRSRRDFNEPLGGFDEFGRSPASSQRTLEVAHWVDGRPVDPDLEVQVRPEAEAGAVADPDDLTLADLLPD